MGRTGRTYVAPGNTPDNTGNAFQLTEQVNSS